MRNAGNILRHELIGLECAIKDAANRSLAGISGKIVDETMKTIVIAGTQGKRKRIPKNGTKFTVAVGGGKVTIDGTHIIARPEDRIKKKFRRW